MPAKRKSRYKVKRLDRLRRAELRRISLLDSESDHDLNVSPPIVNPTEISFSNDDQGKILAILILVIYKYNMTVLPGILMCQLIMTDYRIFDTEKHLILQAVIQIVNMILSISEPSGLS